MLQCFFISHGTLAHYSEQEQQDTTEALKNMDLGSDGTLEQEQQPTAPPTKYTPVAYQVAQQTTDTNVSTNVTNNAKTLSTTTTTLNNLNKVFALFWVGRDNENNLKTRIPTNPGQAKTTGSPVTAATSASTFFDENTCERSERKEQALIGGTGETKTTVHPTVHDEQLARGLALSVIAPSLASALQTQTTITSQYQGERKEEEEEEEEEGAYREYRQALEQYWEHPNKCLSRVLASDRIFCVCE